jgi:hypothetical protein
MSQQGQSDSARELSIRLRLAIQQALVGLITPNMRAVTCGFMGQQITVRAIFAQSPSEMEQDLIEEASTEVVSHFPEHSIISECLQSAPGSPIRNLMLECIAFQRYER